MYRRCRRLADLSSGHTRGCQARLLLSTPLGCLVFYYFGDWIVAVGPIPPLGMAKIEPGKCQGDVAVLAASLGSSAGNILSACGRRTIIRQARRAFQAKGAARAALARWRALAGGSRPSHLHIASDRSSRARPYHFYIWITYIWITFTYGGATPSLD